MKVEIMYKSKRNTKKVAEAMGKALNVKTKEINSSANIEETDILFLGCGIYAGNVHKEVKEFIEKINPQKVKKIVLFSTSASGKDQLQALKDKINECGINLEERTFCCKGKAMMFLNRSNPDTSDLNEAVKFAKTFI